MNNDVDKPSVADVLVIKLSPLNGLKSSMMRTLALVKGLQINGYNVEFLTIRESSTTVLSNSEKYIFLKKAIIKYTDANTTYDYIVSNNKGVKKIIVEVLRKAYHALYPYDYTMNIANNVDIGILSKKQYKYVISVSDPKSSHRAVYNLKKQGLVFQKWIQYWGDPLATDITFTGIYPRFVYMNLEKKLFDKADSIVYTSPFTVLEQKSLFPSFADRMRYVPTAYIEEKIFPKKEGMYCIGYYGAYFSSVRNIMPLYEACSQIKDAKLFIVGDSDIHLSNTPNIEVYPRGEINEFEYRTDLFICILNSSGNQIPGKLYHYAGTNKPILVILDGNNIKEFKSYFKKYNRYIFCKNTKDEIIKTINSIRYSNKKYFPCKNMSCKYIAKQVLEEH